MNSTQRLSGFDSQGKYDGTRKYYYHAFETRMEDAFDINQVAWITDTWSLSPLLLPLLLPSLVKLPVVLDMEMLRTFVNIEKPSGATMKLPPRHCRRSVLY
jgi:hypothetical protein